MSLWSPDDPYGIAILRKVLLTLFPASLVMGIYRSTVRDDEFLYYAIASVLFLVVGLFMEKVFDLATRRQDE